MSSKVSFSTYADIIMGQSPKGEDCNQDGNGIPLLNGPTEFGFKYPSPVQFTTDGRKLSKKNDILFCVRGSTTGRMNYADQEYAIGRGLAAIRGKNNYPTPFLKAILEINLNHLLTIATGSTFPNVSRDMLASFLVDEVLPEKAHRINDIIVSIDDKIELNSTMNQTLEAMAQTIFKNWFVDFEPFKEGKFIESELGMIPEGWMPSSLNNIADYLNGLAMQKYPPESPDEYLPVLKIKELNSGISQNSDKCSTEIPEPFIINDGDMIFSWSGTLEIKLWAGGKAGLNQHLFKVTSNKYEKWFYYLWTKKHLQHFRHIAKGKATTMGHINRNHLNEAEVLIPKKEHLEVMNQIMAPFIEKIIQNDIQIQTLTTLRDTLLPKLMSGEVRV